jgi:tetratricopeptide (TPR) repeat protein
MSATTIILLLLSVQVSQYAVSSEDATEAEKLRAEAAVLYDKGDYTGALRQLDASYAKDPSPRTLSLIAQVNEDLGRLVEAMDALQRHLEIAPNSPETRSRVGHLQQRLGRLTIACDTTGAEITVDGKALGTAPLAKPIWVLPGEHQVLAVRKGTMPVVKRVEVNAGESKEVTVGPIDAVATAQPSPPPPRPMPPAAANSPPALAEVAVGTPVPPNARRGWWLGRKWTWLVAGSAVLVAGAGAIVTYSVRSRFEELRRSCGIASQDKLGCSDDQIESLQTRRDIANALWGVAGAAAVATGIVWLLEGRPVVVAPVAGAVTGMVARMEF